jgi:hypothetical protein
MLDNSFTRQHLWPRVSNPTLDGSPISGPLDESAIFAYPEQTQKN